MLTLLDMRVPHMSSKMRFWSYKDGTTRILTPYEFKLRLKLASQAAHQFPSCQMCLKITYYCNFKRSWIRRTKIRVFPLSFQLSVNIPIKN